MDFHLRPSGSWTAELNGAEVLFGDGVLDQLGEQVHAVLRHEPAAAEARGDDAVHVLLVTDPGVQAAGHSDRALAMLAGAGVEVRVFSELESNPTSAHVEAGRAMAEAWGRVDLILGFGGGSAMDCAKGINFLLSNGGRMEDYWGTGLASRPMLPSIGVPTTAGTGSEAQSYALISQTESKRKMACGDRKARFRSVLLDPQLISSVPRETAAHTGIDAVTHAIESYVSTRHNPISRLFSREAWRLLDGALESYLVAPEDPQARRAMLLGSFLAGSGIELAMLGAAHACANPLTARHGVPHGCAVGLMLPPVVRFNAADPASDAAAAYGELLQSSDLEVSEEEAGERLALRLEQLNRAAGLGRLQAFGVDAASLPRLAAEAAQQWTASFNPRPVTELDLEHLYLEALEPRRRGEPKAPVEQVAQAVHEGARAS